MRVRRAEIVSMLRSRGLTARADWVERALPEVVDTGENHSLLSTLGIDPEVLCPVGNVPQPA